MTLEEWRKAKGWTYAQLAHKVGAANAKVVHRWCHGEAMPTPEFQMAIQEATGGAVGPWSWALAVGVAEKGKGR